MRMVMKGDFLWASRPSGKSNIGAKIENGKNSPAKVHRLFGLMAIPDLLLTPFLRKKAST